jgi:3-oxoadipate enol-lactonase
MFIDLDSHLSHVRVQGNPGRRAIVMLHSLGTSGAIWDPQADALAGEFHVIRPDFRGHGYSELGTDPVTIDLLADDIATTVATLGLPPFVLAGISIGGLVAQKVAARLGNSLRALVLLDSSIASLNPQMWIERARQVRENGLAASADKITKPWSSKAGQGSADARGLRQILLQTSDEAYARGCDALAVADCRSAAAAIAVPTLVAVGAEDLATPLSASEELASAIPGARLKVIDNAGHIPLLEQAAIVTALLRDMLGSAPHSREE